MIPLLLATFQVASQSATPLPATVTPAMLARMDAVFAKPVLAPFRASYLRERERGLTMEMVGQFAQVRFGDFHLSFFEGTDRIRVFRWGNFQPIVGERLPTSRLMQTAESAIEQLSDVPRPNRVAQFLKSQPNEFVVTARRVAFGLPIEDALVATVNAVTGNLNYFFNTTATPLDVEPHGGDPVRPDEALRELAYDRMARDRPRFDQAQLIQDETVIGPDYGNAGVAIPKHGMLWMSPEGNSYGVSIDARDGRVLGSLYAPAQGGGSSSDAPPLPKRVRVGRAEGALNALGKTTSSPPETRVRLVSGKTLFLGRFEIKTGTLWLRRMRDEPYQTFRPDAALRKALAAQVRRAEALGKG